MFSRKKLWNQPDETKWDNRFFLLFGPFRDTISPIIILQSMIRDNHKTWFRHIYDSLLSNFWRFSTIMILLTENWWQIVDKRSKDQETLEILREKSQTFLGTASNRFSCVSRCISPKTRIKGPSGPRTTRPDRLEVFNWWTWSDQADQLQS